MIGMVAAVSAAVIAAPNSPATHSPIPLAVDASITIDGHGYGHGIGLSQWGAYGYAVDHGWTAAQILDRYYGGTVAGAVPVDSLVTVRLQGVDDQQTAVVSATGGLVIVGFAGGPWKSVVAREVSQGVYGVWARSDVESCPVDGVALAAGWTQLPVSSPSSVTIRTSVDSNATTRYSDLASVCYPGGATRAYRGAIRAINGPVGENRTVNEVAVEQYLRSVIAKEMSPSWAAAGGGKGSQALQAQAVAARSYGMAEGRTAYAKTCDSTSCQAYMGAATRVAVGGAFTQVEYPSTDAAVAATAGVVRRVGSTSGSVAYTQFSASSGGWTAAGSTRLGPFPAVQDDGDDVTLNPNHNWSVPITASSIAAKYPSIGSLSSISITGRNGQGDWGGRVTQLKLLGTAGSVTITGDSFKSAMGLKSNWFNVRGTVNAEPCVGRNEPPVGADLPTAAGAKFNPITPVRLIDTRDGTGTNPVRLLGGCTLVVQTGLAGVATAASVNLTAINPTVAGYLSVYPCGVTRPTASVVQTLPNRVIAGSTVVRLAADGTFCVFSNVDLDLVVDMFGSYSTTSGVRFEPTNPLRLYDSRTTKAPPAAGTVIRVPVVRAGRAPSGATAAALTLHAIGATGNGYLTVYPCNADRPLVSSLNTAAGTSITNHVQVALNGAGEVCVYLHTSMHVVLDLSGWFGAAATTNYYAITPLRVLDSRPDANIGLAGAFRAGANRALPLAGVGGLPAAGTMRAVLAEVTAVAPSAAGYLTVHPCLAPVPSVSMVRYIAGANAATTVIGADDVSGRWCVVSSTTLHVVIDVSGYFA